MSRLRHNNNSTSPVNIMCFVLFLSHFFSTPNALTGGDRWRDRQTSEGTDGEGKIHGSGGDTGAVVGGRNATPALPDHQSFDRTHQRSQSRTNYETWVLNEIKDMILNATGRGGATPFPPPGPPVEANPLSDPSSVSPPVNKSQRPTGKRNPVEEVTFPPDEVSKHRNDAFIQFTLHNYTGKGRLEGAELMLLLRYNQPANHQPPILDHRKPDVRRVSIEVYKDAGNATHDGNASSSSSSSSPSSDRTPMTSSLFRIRRTKWVKVLLIRSWIKDAVETHDKILRLHLVYDGSGAVDVVMTGREKTKARRGKKRKRNLERGGPEAQSRRNLRDPSGSRQSGEQRIAKRNLDRRNLFSPLLVIRQRGKSTSS